jgi:hypothetical protein
LAQSLRWDELYESQAHIQVKTSNHDKMVAISIETKALKCLMLIGLPSLVYTSVIQTLNLE